MIELDVRRNKELEIKIVNLTEKLIQNVIKASLKDEEERTFILEDSQNIILELSNLIHFLIQDDEHLESMLNQLIFQKLPADHIIDSFEDFNNILSDLIKRGVDKYRFKLNEDLAKGEINNINTLNEIKNENIPEKQLKNFQKNDFVNSTPVCNNQEADKFVMKIKSFFPNIKVEKKVNFNGEKIQYYIPQFKTIINIIDDKKDFKKTKGLRDLMAEKKGIKIISVASPDFSINKLKKLLNHKKILEKF